MKVQKVKLNNLDFILTEIDGGDSPIATISSFQKGECSYAHLYRDSGEIMQFHSQIGTIEDIEFGELVDIEIEPENFFSGMLGKSWPL